MCDMPSCLRLMRRGRRYVSLLAATILFVYAIQSAADILPESGTFSGVYHRDRWGVGRFDIFLVSPKLRAPLKEFEDRPISLEVKVARQRINPGPSEILEIGGIEALEAPKVNLRLVVTSDGTQQGMVQFTCFVTNSSEEIIDFSLNDLMIQLYSPRVVKNGEARSLLFPDFTNHQMSVHEDIVQWLNRHFAETKHFAPPINMDQGHHVQLTAGQSVPLVIRRGLGPAEYEARVRLHSLWRHKPEWKVESWHRFDVPGAADLLPKGTLDDPASGLAVEDVEYRTDDDGVAHLSFTVRDGGEKPRKILACLRGPEPVLAGTLTGVDGEGKPIDLWVRERHGCFGTDQPWRLAEVGPNGIRTTVDLAKPGGGQLKPKRLKFEILTELGLATFWTDAEKAK